MLNLAEDNTLRQVVNVKMVPVKTNSGEKLRQSFERGPLARGCMFKQRYDRLQF